MARLPTPGGDENQWGNVLNDFLSQAHNPDGTLRQSAITQAGGYVSSQLPGYELAVAQKADTSFVTSSTSAVDIPGLSITFTVPARPYVVRFYLHGQIEEVGASGQILVQETTSASVVGQTRAAKANTNQDAIMYYFETRIPGAFHAPAAGATVTYQLQALSSVGTSDFTILSGDLGGFGQWVATLVAFIQ